MNSATRVKLGILAIVLVSSGLPSNLAAKGFCLRLAGATNDPPLITADDLLEYRFAEHTFTIRSQAVARLPKLKSIDGEPFEVLVDGQTIYSGRFVPDVSSKTYREPTIWMSYLNPTTNLSLTIRRSFYHEPIFAQGHDPRFDPRIRQALAESSKLVLGKVERGDYDPDLTERAETVLREMQHLRKGSKRRDFLAIFMVDRGVLTEQKTRFVHRRCPYLKLDVAFEPVAVPRDNPESMLDDVASEVSRPYLDYSNSNILDQK